MHAVMREYLALSVHVCLLFRKLFHNFRSRREQSATPAMLTFCPPQNQAKVHMPKNVDNTPMDDDILDLTEVVEAGKTLPPDSPDSIGADFGADLDALLDSLASDTAAAAPKPAAPVKPVAPAKPVAAPIADQTPAGHVVDPNEELAMPGTADIDSLLAELGVEPTKASAAKPAPDPEPDFETEPEDAAQDVLPDDLAAMIADAPAAKPKAAAPPPADLSDVDLPAAQADIDSLLAELDKTAAKEAPAPKAPLDDLPDDLAAMIAAAPAAQPVAEPAPQPAPLDDLPDDLAAMIAAAPSATVSETAPAAEVSQKPKIAIRPAPAKEIKAFPVTPDPVAEAPAPVADIPKTDGIDLNELDALLDGMLAAAPPSGGVKAEALPAQEAAEPEGIAAPASSAQAASGQAVDPALLDGLTARMDALENELAAVQAVLAAAEAAPPAEVAAAPAEPQLDSVLPNLAALESEVAALRAVVEAAPAAQAAPDAEEAEAAAAAAVEVKVEELLAPGSPLMERISAGIAAAVLTRLGAGLAGEGDTETDPALLAAAENFRRDLEKTAASAAAKVIREEIVALMQGQA